MPTLIVLIGPTGVGKTELSLRLAENFQTHIVSADSRQLYAELKIGTAAPTPEQLERVPHHLVGTLHLTDYYSAAQYETEAMEELLQTAGYDIVPFTEQADVYVVNTCTVTNTGDSKSRQMIRKAIRKNPQATVCVVGCYSQVAPQDIEAIEGVSIILGTQFRNEIVDLVEKYQQTHERIVKVSEVKQLRKFEDLNIDRFLHTRAYLKIQDGCNNFCTYCIIPYARGRVRSRKPESVIKQAKELVAKGYVEIVLTGIHTAGYGEDLENYSFYDLLVDLTKIEGLKRLRISSIETSQITDDIIDDTLHLLCIGDHKHIIFN